MAEPSHVSQVEWIAKSETVRVRINTLPAQDGTPWHFHTVITDNMFCLEGELEISLREPAQTVVLRPGERQTVLPGRIHRVFNRGDRDLRYLLVQAAGAYDFNSVEDNPPA